MTTKRVPKEKKPGRVLPQNPFKGFVNISLTDSIKEDILNEQDESQALEKHVDALLTAGFKVSFSYDENSACYQTTATGTQNAGESSGWATSARSEDITRALLALSAKVIVIAECDLSAFAGSGKGNTDI